MGYESKRDEPLPFQIIDVSSISIHPGYKQGHGGYDLAILHLNSPIILDLHINPLCLPDSKYLSRNDRPCISTGWGKSILQGNIIYIYIYIDNRKLDSLENQKISKESVIEFIFSYLAKIFIAVIYSRIGYHYSNANKIHRIS